MHFSVELSQRCCRLEEPLVLVEWLEKEIHVTMFSWFYIEGESISYLQGNRDISEFG